MKKFDVLKQPTPNPVARKFGFLSLRKKVPPATKEISTVQNSAAQSSLSAISNLFTKTPPGRSLLGTKGVVHPDSMIQRKDLYFGNNEMFRRAPNGKYVDISKVHYLNPKRKWL